MVTVGTRWYLLGLAAAPLYQRVPTSPNSHKHFQDSNSLGGTTFSQVRGLKFPVVCLESGDKPCSSERPAAGKAAAQRPFRSIPPHLVAQKSLLLRIGLRRHSLSDLSPDLSPDCTGSHYSPIGGSAAVPQALRASNLDPISRRSRALLHYRSIRGARRDLNAQKLRAHISPH